MGLAFPIMSGRRRRTSRWHRPSWCRECKMIFSSPSATLEFSCRSWNAYDYGIIPSSTWMNILKNVFSDLIMANQLIWQQKKIVFSPANAPILGKNNPLCTVQAHNLFPKMLKNRTCLLQKMAIFRSEKWTIPIQCDLLLLKMIGLDPDRQSLFGLTITFRVIG